MTENRPNPKILGPTQHYSRCLASRWYWIIGDKVLYLNIDLYIIWPLLFESGLLDNCTLWWVWAAYFELFFPRWLRYGRFLCAWLFWVSHSVASDLSGLVISNGQIFGLADISDICNASRISDWIFGFLKKQFNMHIFEKWYYCGSVHYERLSGENHSQWILPPDKIHYER